MYSPPHPVRVFIYVFVTVLCRTATTSLCRDPSSGSERHTIDFFKLFVGRERKVKSEEGEGDRPAASFERIGL